MAPETALRQQASLLPTSTKKVKPCLGARHDLHLQLQTWLCSIWYNLEAGAGFVSPNNARIWFCLPLQVSVFCVPHEEQVFNDVCLHSHHNGSRSSLETQRKQLAVPMSSPGTWCSPTKRSSRLCCWLHHGELFCFPQ